jgi:M6 family metalloprotease-like protein
MGLAAALAACDMTEPHFADPPPTPYVRNVRGVRVFGTTRVLVIPTRWADGLPSSLDPGEIERRYFGSGNDGPMSMVYRLAAEDRFALRGTVAPWVTTTVKLTDTGAGQVALTREGDHVIEAIQASDPAIDFGRFDDDGPDGIPNSGDDDGVIDGGLVILNSDIDMKCAGGRGPHPHAVLSPPGWIKNRVDTLRTRDARPGGGFIGVTGYTIQSVVDCFGGGSNAQTLTHELGHLLFNMPDLYHMVDGSVPLDQRWKGRRWVVGCWDLMAAGSSWGCGSGTPNFATPNATFGAWSRMVIGWTQPVEARVDVEGTYDLLAPGRGGWVVKLPITKTEYVLAEYRESVIGDLGLPGNGVLLYHVDDSLSFRPNPTAKRQYRVQLIEADDDSALVRIDSENGNRGTAGDAFGKGVNAFAHATHSMARRTNGDPLPWTISSIQIDPAGGRAKITVRPAAPP